MELLKRILNYPVACEESCRRTPGEREASTAVSVDAAGDVFAAGTLRNIGSAPAFTVMKFSGADGTERWRRLINGSANAGDGPKPSPSIPREM